MSDDAVYEVLSRHLPRVAASLTLKPGDSFPSHLLGDVWAGSDPAMLWEFRYRLSRPDGDGERFCDAVRADPVLKRLWPEAVGDLLGDRTAWLVTNGSGGVKQLVLWSSDLLAAVESAARILGGTNLDELHDHLRTILTSCREAATGR
jgi:hypothetical protein